MIKPSLLQSVRKFCLCIVWNNYNMQIDLKYVIMYLLDEEKGAMEDSTPTTII